MNLCELKKVIPPEYENFKIEDMYGKPEVIDPIKETLSAYLKNSVENEKNGRGLLFIGPKTGTGKTYSAYHVLGEVAKDRVKWDRKHKQLTRGYTDIVSILVPDYLKHCNRFEADSVALTQEVMTCPFLLLDELSADSFKNNLASGRVDLFSLVDYRVIYNLPTLYTSNCTSLDEVKTLTGPKLFDRITYKTIVINYSGPSVRPIITERLQSEISGEEEGRDPDAVLRAENEMLKAQGEH